MEKLILEAKDYGITTVVSIYDSEGSYIGRVYVQQEKKHGSVILSVQRGKSISYPKWRKAGHGAAIEIAASFR